MREMQSEVKWEKKEEEEEKEEAEAQVEIWKYIFGFVELSVVKCAIQLGIAEAIENHKKPMSLLELSSSLKCDPSYLNRIMRFLVHRKIFKTISTNHDNYPSYVQTPLSRRLIRNGEHSMTALLLLESSPVMVAPWLSLSDRVLVNGNPSFKKAHGEDLWSYAASNIDHSNLLNDAMACDAKVVVPAIVEGCSELFDGVGSLVDVGGGNGTTLSILVKAFPWIQGINFDLPHVIDVAPKYDGVEHVAGDMFTSVPKADVVFFKWVLHDWGDEECIKILKNSREAIPKENGKVIIVEAVIEEEEGGGKHNKYEDVGLMLDMVMMAHTNIGKERTLKEWEHVIKMAGFNRFTVKSINAAQSVIVASC
ncbi:acetylserotonin O-methyltransferase-like [Vicia villosa]|uniref:acetylserotonin O-methyltransferase-like n=1 Tax=Vicia villosa TaxID=3911 RepID=UPI00273CF26E|nr:acetylserotonin O-methyltransferase-like [Vicia villosa]